MPNYSLGWEKTSSVNIGLDFSILNNRISGSLEYYQAETSDLLMNKSLPVITSSINHFSDLNTIKANSAEEIAKELDVLFSNKKAAEQQVVKQLEYLNDNTWEKVALKYINIFKGII
jgi:hypothetical protein